MFMSRAAAILIVCLLLAGCSTTTPLPTADASPTPAVTNTSVPSATRLPSSTPRPSPTALASMTATVTSTFTPTPDPVLEDVRLLGVSWQKNYDLLLSIQFPGPVDASQYKVMVEDKWYRCQVLPQEPSRLFCVGQGMRVYDRVTVQIFPEGSDRPGFRGTISIPYFTN
jgi:hypothetical protein